MSNPRKLQVFISSTFEDMKVERAAAVNAILGAGHIPAGMELFSAGDESQLNTIYRWIEDSDIYLLLLGGRYGTIEKQSGKSYTELEYIHAVEIGKPFFALAIKDEALEAKIIKNGLGADERKNEAKLRDFRSNVLSRTSEFYSDSKDIQLAIFKSLNDLSRNQNLIGWIRADSIDSRELLEENRKLRHDLDEMEERSAKAGLNSLLPEIPDLDSNVNLIFLKSRKGYLNSDFTFEILTSWILIYPIFYSTAKYSFGDYNGIDYFSIELDRTRDELSAEILNQLGADRGSGMLLSELDVKRLHAYYVEICFIIDGAGTEPYSDLGKSMARRALLVSSNFRNQVSVLQGQVPKDDAIPF